jgi:hypothetical protein
MGNTLLSLHVINLFSLVGLDFIESHKSLNALSQEKESLITELRKELQVSDKEHRELLNRVNSDDIIRRIRYFVDT